MAQAIKCDRCGKFCDCDEVDDYKVRMATHGDWAYTVHKTHSDGSTFGVDLCVSCLKELRLFMEGKKTNG